MSAAERDDGCDWYFGVPFPSKRKEAEAAVKERELKVGDLVRASGGYTFDPIVGVIDKAEEDKGFRVRANVLHDHMGDKDNWFYYKDELTLLPTFATGARVKLTRHVHRFAAGDTGTVTVSNDENVGVHMDEGRYWAFKPDDLAVVPAPDCAGRNGEQGKWSITMDSSGYTSVISYTPVNDPATPCIVMRLDDGEPRPSYCPHIHPSADSATKEAERLASVNPGKQFDVYQRVTGRVAEQHIEMKVA